MLLKFDYFYFTKELFKANDFRIRSGRPDSSAFRIKFHQDFDFHKIKKKHLFAKNYIHLSIDNLKRHTLEAGYSRLRSVDLNCVHFWNQGLKDIFYHQTQKNSCLNKIILWV